MIGDPQWTELNRLFDEAVDLPVEERARLLGTLRLHNPPLGERLARMLNAHDHPGPLDKRIAPMDDSSLQEHAAAALRDRYRLDEPLGVGGMAAVFLAHETKHDRKVVVKVLQPRLAAAIGTARFLDEIRISAKLSHPHILALIDSGEADGLLYYVTPFVGGETLRERLARSGALPLADAVGLLRDVADALAHAHDAGVVHRDLKPENVLCVGSHAFLLDFGVAKLEAGAAVSRPTDPGLAIGTPGYMAPEQVVGVSVDHRADIYVWGLLARELLTGKRLLDAPLGTLRADIPRSLVALIEACVALDPVERPSSAASLVAALDGLIAPVRVAPRWPWFAAAAMTPILIGLLLAGKPAKPAVAVLTGPIAVTPLDDETADTALAGWGRLAGDWMTQGLHEANLLPVVPWESSLLASERLHNETAAGRLHDFNKLVREETGAGAIVRGSYYRTGDSLRFQATVVDARSGALLIAVTPVVVLRDSAAAGVRELRDRVMGAIGLALDQRVAAGSAFATQPPTYEAYRSFDRGLAHFNRYEYAAARVDLQDAWNHDSTFFPALILGSYAAANDNDWVAADTLIRLALWHRPLLNEFYLSFAEMMVGTVKGDKERALRGALRGSALAPGSRLPYNAAHLLEQLNRPREADSVLAAMDADHGPMRDWPAYWSQRAFNNHLLGDYDEELTMARTMRARHPMQRVSWVIEARADAALGREQELDSLVEVARSLEPDVYWSVGAMLVIAGQEALVHQRGNPALRFQQAVDFLAPRLRIDPTDRNHRNWLAYALIGLGQRDSAERVLLKLDHDEPDRLANRGRLAVLTARRGDRAGAERWMLDAPAHQRGEALLYEARMAAVLGDKETALTRLADALRAGVDNWHWNIHYALPDFAIIAHDPRFTSLVTPH
ncbi:MAG: protein kinase [Gemmatimonadales bacterium]